jgi:TetR/AcrR family transcriptional regulator
MAEQKPNRRTQILQALAEELERQPHGRITTAQLAKALGVSEAALYRHFPSKARMFEGLIEFAEETVFGLQRRIVDQHAGTSESCKQMITVLLGFGTKNPGITSVLLGHAIVGENPRLQARVGQFFEQSETRIRQVLNRHGLESATALPVQASVAADLLMSYARGRLLLFLHSGFRQPPDAEWERQWPQLEHAVFKSKL